MGVTLTWIVPHSFAQQPTMTVDYRIMLSLLELYEPNEHATPMMAINFLHDLARRSASMPSALLLATAW